MGLFLAMAAAVFGLFGSFTPAVRAFSATVMVALFLYSKAVKLRHTRRIDNTIVMQGFIFCFMCLYVLLKSMWAWFYLGLAALSHIYSGFTGALVFRPIDLGMTYSGIDTVVLFVIAFTITFFFAKGITGKRILLGYGLVLLVWSCYIMLWTALAENSMTYGLYLIEPVTGPLDYKAVLFVMLLALYYAVCGKMLESIGEGQEWNRYKWRFLALLLLCLGIGFFWMLPPVKPVQLPGRHIVFWDSLTDYSVPDNERYGLDNVGMFGVLPHYLSRNGYTWEIIEEISEDTLANADVFVTFNPFETPDETALAALWGFVESGGSALLVGDHTGTEQMRAPINAILKPTGMEINFDSAVPFKSLWTDDFVLRKDPIFAGVLDRQIQMVVGASISVPFGGKPLVIGKAGFSDEGDLDNDIDGFLGDMHFTRGERIGDLVLAAEASYGKGRFMLFADTSLFQNTVLAYSYPFIDNIFAKLCANGTKDSGLAYQEEELQYACSGIVDMAHIEKIGRDKTGHSIDAVFSASLRAGIMPYINMELEADALIDAFGDAAYILIVEPAARFNEKEKQALEGFVSAGGSLLLCGNYDSPMATVDLAGFFGFAFDDLPLGRVSPLKDPEMAFWNACPLLYGGEPVRERLDEVDCLMDVWGYGVIASKDIGRGKLYVFGDPEFFKNKNVEDVETYRQGNVDFIDRLLKIAAEKGGV